MGYLGWTEAETLDHTPEMIRLAEEGRIELINKVLKGIFGPGQANGPTQLAGGMAPTVENLAKIFDRLG